MLSRLSENQIEVLSKYFSDVSKIILASTVITFFVPGDVLVSLPVFLLGFMASIGFLILSVYIIKIYERR